MEVAMTSYNFNVKLGLTAFPRKQKFNDFGLAACTSGLNWLNFNAALKISKAEFFTFLNPVSFINSSICSLSTPSAPFKASHLTSGLLGSAVLVSF